jgi:hypothetical protein
MVVFLVKMHFFKQRTCAFETNITMFSKVPIINKRRHPTKGKKGTRWKDPSSGKKKKLPMLVDRKGNMNKSSIETS